MWSMCPINYFSFDSFIIMFKVLYILNKWLLLHFKFGFADFTFIPPKQKNIKYIGF